MAPQKRKVDPTLIVESDESPHKRARSESTNDTANRQNGNGHSSDVSSDSFTKHSKHLAKRLRNSHAAPSEDSEAALLSDLPQSWDQASATDKMLVKMKMKNTKIPWARIEQDWERLTGYRPARDILSNRYRSLKVIMARSESGAASGGNVKSEVAEEPFETSDYISKRPTTAAKTSDPAFSAPSAKSSRTISNRSKAAPKPRSEAAAKPLKNPSAAYASTVAHEQDLPQSWEQADAGDQLIVRMKGKKRGWSEIGEAWRKLTGKKPAEGALEDRYTRMKDFVIRPGTNGADTDKHAKPMLRTPRTRRAEAEPSEESLDQSSDQSSDDFQNEFSDEYSKQPMAVARRNPRDATGQETRASTHDGPSNEPISKGTKTTAKNLANGRAEAGSSDEQDEVSKNPVMVANSAKRPRAKPAVAANPEAQNTTETADEMLEEMRERGCTWVEITEAWNERTGRNFASDSLRKRYARKKKGSSTKLKSRNQASSKRKVRAVSPDEGLYESSAKRNKSTTEALSVAKTPTKRNIDRMKRKSSVKYTDSTTDEDELFSASVEPISTTPARRNAGRPAKVNRSDPEWLVTNEKSPLADENLHAEFSDPKTYENFTRSDWEDIRETLPSNVPLNSDGYSIPMTFFKYDPDFRRGIREFQEDLASGRLDPEWQADAAQAMEERARGEFDAYKEDQFEAFWGQKQKLSRDALAGESTKVKLDVLIQNEIFKVGDYFSYSRVFGRRKDRVLIEKDCRVRKGLDVYRSS